MITIRERIDSEIDWVIKETTRLKVIPYKYNLAEEDKNLYLKSVVPMVYAYLEGFVKKAFTIYLEYVNEKNLEYKDISIKLLVYQLEKKYNCFEGKIKNLDSKEKIINSIIKDYQNKNTKMVFNYEKVQNINFDRLNKILEEMNFSLIDDKEIKDGLNKLLRFRNGIAHGENSFNVTNQVLFEFIDIITRTMDIISDIVIEGYINENYLNKA